MIIRTGGPMAVHEAEPESPRHATPNEQKLCSTPDTGKRKALLEVRWFRAPSGHQRSMLAPRASGHGQMPEVPPTLSAFVFTFLVFVVAMCRGLQTFKLCSGICPT